MVVLDANTPREVITAEQTDDDIFTMDDCKSINTVTNKMKNVPAHTLDVCLDRIFNFIIVECHDLDTGQLNWEKTKKLYHTLIYVFDEIILPTYNIHHVQFVMFFICSLKPAITEAFINHLCKKVYSPNIAPITRQTAVVYIASFLARSAFINLR